MQTNHTIAQSSELGQKAQALIKAAHEYWEVHQREACGGAVVWLEAENGHFVLFTRGEYKDAIVAAATRECRGETSMFEPFVKPNQ